MKRLLSFLLFLPTWLGGFAQQPFSYALDPDNIPSQEVYRVIQDDKGYIWIGCNAGLFGYDGNRFKQYLNAEMSGRALSNLELDPFGRLWCGTFTGQLLFVENDSLQLFVDWSEKETQFPAFCTAEKNVWITSDNGLFQWQSEGEQKKYSLSDSESQNTENVFVTSKGRVLVYSNRNGFFRLDKPDDQLNKLVIPSHLNSFKEGRSFFIEWNGKQLALWQRNSDGKTVWVEILGDQIQLFHALKETEITSRVNRVLVSKQNEIWACTNAGAVRVSSERQQTFFSDQRISDVFLDREGNYWFTTLDNGIFVMPNLDIQHFGKEFFGESLSNIISLEEGKNGEVLLGHYDGTVSSFNQTSETLETVLEPKKGIHRSAETLVFDNGRLLAARGPLSIQKHKQSVDVLEGGNAKDIVALAVDTLLIATVTELAKLYPSYSGSWHRQTLREGFCRSVVVTENGTIWAAFKDGVFYGNDEKFEPFLRNDKPVYAAEITVDDADNLWIATISNGLLKISGAQIVAEFNTSNGLGSNDLHCVSISHDTVWVAHAQGLDRLVNGEFHHFNLLDGMPLKEANDILVEDGFVYLASHSGLTILPTTTEAENQTAPKLFANSLFLGDSSISTSENTSYRYDQNELKIDLSVLAFRSRGTCKVKYRLDGLDTTWAEQSGNRIEIVYNALPAGDFQFEAVALNEDGVPSDETVSFSFTIKPPFWQTWWFYLLAAILTIGVVSVLFSLRIRHIRRKAALEHAVVSSKLTALRSQMNPHFLFNALNSIQELVLIHDTKNAIRYLGTFSGLTRKILENSAKETVRLSEELDMLNQYLELEKLRFGDSLQINMEVGSQIDTEGIRIPPMLIQPYVENALKHGLLHLQSDRKLHLKFEQKADFLIVEIEDNGVGRAKAEEFAKQKKKHQSFSSEATENRLHSMKNVKGISGSVEVADLHEGEKAVGTKVTLVIPFL
ncbi:MAG: histidine kinase [Flavobacteriales bacterium]|nr:histidine kinase [Flavobacteriales bacterium]